ncbi:MAG: hypothetical protein H8Z69_01145 [Nanohaloarchaea archaeon]|nr:hypothetical protein [Candidatus Nanohaloarchaea archaeon]
MGSSADFPSSSSNFKHRRIRAEGSSYILTEGNLNVKCRSESDLIAITDLGCGKSYASTKLTDSDYGLWDPLKEMSGGSYADKLNEFGPEEVWAVEETKSDTLEKMRSLLLDHEDPTSILEPKSEPVRATERSMRYY